MEQVTHRVDEDFSGLFPLEGKVKSRRLEGEVEFATRTLELLQDRALRAKLGRDAQAYAATWSASEMAKRLVDLYRATLEPAPLIREV